MRKEFLFLLTLCCAVSLTGCNSRSLNNIIENEPNVTGIVTEVYDNSFLMLGEPTEGYPNAEKYSVSLKVENEDSYASVAVGDEVVVYHNGEIAESDPLQINTVYAITLKTAAAETIIGESKTTEWLDGVTFIDLVPGEEVKSSTEVIVKNDNTIFQYSITYGRAALTLEYGLQAVDGTEYSREIIGGSEIGLIENIPAGTYHLFVRNSGDYSDLPAYQNKSMSYNATGAMNYAITD